LIVLVGVAELLLLNCFVYNICIYIYIYIYIYIECLKLFHFYFYFPLFLVAVALLCVILCCFLKLFYFVASVPRSYFYQSRISSKNEKDNNQSWRLCSHIVTEYSTVHLYSTVNLVTVLPKSTSSHHPSHHHHHDRYDRLFDIFFMTHSYSTAYILYANIKYIIKT
jgi:hypothetical protein